MKTGPQAPPFDLKLFKSMDIPPAVPGKDIIFLTGFTYQDGVGDLAIMLDVGREVAKEFKAKGYKIYGLTYLGEKGRSFYQHRKAEFEEVFDTFYEQENHAERFDLTKISKDVDATICNIRLPYSPRTPSVGNCHKVVISEFGFVNPQTLGTMMRSAAMGLEPDRGGEYAINYPEDNFISYGIKIPIEKESLSAAEKLIGVDEEPFLRNLLNKREGQLTVEDAQNYLNTHDFMPAYAQSPVQALFFMMTQIYKNQNENGELTKPVDFLFPKMAMHVEFLVGQLKKLGIEDFVMIRQGKEEVFGDPSKAKIRIFSEYIKKDADYDALFSVSHSVVGASGNSTICTAIASESLPLMLWYGTTASGFALDFMKLVEEHTSGGKNSLLYEYFSLHTHQMTFSDVVKYGGADNILALDCEYHGATKETMDKSIDSKYDKLLERAQRIGALSKNDAVLVEWQHVREVLIKNYNFYDHLPSIVKGAIAITQESQGIENKQFKTCLLQSEPIQKLMQNGILSDEVVLAMPFASLEIIADPTVNDLLFKKTLTLDQLKGFKSEHLRTALNANTKDAREKGMVMIVTEPFVRVLSEKDPFHFSLKDLEQMRSSALAKQIIINKEMDPLWLRVEIILKLLESNKVKASDFPPYDEKTHWDLLSRIPSQDVDKAAEYVRKHITKTKTPEPLRSPGLVNMFMNLFSQKSQASNQENIDPVDPSAKTKQKDNTKPG